MSSSASPKLMGEPSGRLRPVPILLFLRWASSSWFCLLLLWWWLCTLFDVAALTAVRPAVLQRRLQLCLCTAGCTCKDWCLVYRPFRSVTCSDRRWVTTAVICAITMSMLH